MSSKEGEFTLFCFTNNNTRERKTILVTGLLRQMEGLGAEVYEVKEGIESYGTVYITTATILWLGCLCTLLLTCPHSARLKQTLSKVRQGLPPTLEAVRRNVQELVRICRISIGALEGPNQQGPNRHLNHNLYPTIPPPPYGGQILANQNIQYNGNQIPATQTIYGYTSPQCAPGPGIPTTPPQSAGNGSGAA